MFNPMRAGTRFCSMLGCALLLTAPATAQSQVIDLPRAMALTEAHNAELALYPYLVRVREGELLQASLRPQPTLDFEAENLMLNGDQDFFDRGEYSLTLGQTLELGGKRARRGDVARAGREQDALEFRLSRLDTLAETGRRYYRILALQYENNLLERQSVALERVLAASRRQARAGVIGDADIATMELAVARLGLERQRGIAAERLAHLSLAAMWQNPEQLRAEGWELGQPLPAPGFDSVAGELDSPKLESSIELDKRITQALTQAPSLERDLALERLADSQLALAEAEGRSDVKLGVGLRHFESTGDQALLLSASMPIGFSNPNRGRVASARAQREWQGREGDRRRLLLQQRVSEALLRLTMAGRSAAQIESELLPQSRGLIAATEKGFLQGRYSLLQWQQALSQELDLERQLIAERLEQYLILLDLERISGLSLTAMAEGEQP